MLDMLYFGLVMNLPCGIFTQIRFLYKAKGDMYVEKKETLFFGCSLAEGFINMGCGPCATLCIMSSSTLPSESSASALTS